MRAQRIAVAVSLVWAVYCNYRKEMQRREEWREKAKREGVPLL